jgi:hypothetical protein
MLRQETVSDVSWEQIDEQQGIAVKNRRHDGDRGRSGRFEQSLASY